MLHHRVRHASAFGSHRKNVARGSIRLHLLLAILAVTAGVTYVFFVNDLSTKGYEIQSLKMTSVKIVEELAKMKQAASSAQSVDALHLRLKAYSFVPEGAVEYAHPASPVAYQGGNP